MSAKTSITYKWNTHSDGDKEQKCARDTIEACISARGTEVVLIRAHKLATLLEQQLVKDIRKNWMAVGLS